VARSQSSADRRAGRHCPAERHRSAPADGGDVARRDRQGRCQTRTSVAKSITALHGGMHINIIRPRAEDGTPACYCLRIHTAAMPIGAAMVTEPRPATAEEKERRRRMLETNAPRKRGPSALEDARPAVAMRPCWPGPAPMRWLTQGALVNSAQGSRRRASSRGRGVCYSRICSAGGLPTSVFRVQRYICKI
jgi:hypothetical protein